jgi:general nucleoside transport system permease protein
MLPAVPVPGLSRLPVLGHVLFDQSVLVYVAYAALVVSWVIFSRTEWGTRLRAVGENPRAADSVGLSVARLRYLAAVANGALGGIGGAFLTLAMLGFFMENVTSGRGYIALVVVILGKRHPVGVFLAALMLGAADALQFRVQAMGVPIPSQVFLMFPYVATVVVLLLTAGRSHPPAALGIPFDRRER